MTFLKVGICFALGYLLYNNIDGKTFIITYATMVFLFVVSKNINVRGLIVILTIHIFIMYESLYITYYVTKYGLETGKLIGDMTHNIIAILCYLGLLFAIYYREEVTAYFYRNKSFVYMPTKADIVQIFITQILLVYNIGYTVFLGYYAIQHTLTVDLDPELAKDYYDTFSEHVWLYREYAAKLGSIKLFSFSLLLLSWAEQRSGKDTPEYRWTDR